MQRQPNELQVLRFPDEDLEVLASSHKVSKVFRTHRVLEEVSGILKEILRILEIV